MICIANQWTGFYKIRTSVMKKLRVKNSLEQPQNANLIYYYLQRSCHLEGFRKSNLKMFMLSENTIKGTHVLSKLESVTRLTTIFLQINFLFNKIYFTKALDKCQIFSSFSRSSRGLHFKACFTALL